MGAIDRIFRGRRGGQDRPLAAQIAALFANGEQGLWYDIEGFRDSWNSVGPERLANPSFDDGLTGWTVAQPAGATIGASGGVLSFTADGATYAAISQSTTLNVGTLYVVTLEGVSGTGSLKVVGIDTEVQFAASRSFIGRATSTTFAIARVSGVAAAMSIGRVSVKEWTGLPTCNLFQDAVGSTPAYLPGQGQVDPPIGLVMDRRKGIARGPEMLTNGDFSAGATGWTVSNADATHIATFSGGTIRYQSDTTSPVLQVSQVGPSIIAGRWYEVTIVVSSWTSGGLKTDTLNGNAASGLTLAQGAGTFRSIGLATSSTSSFSFTRNSANVDITIDSISLRELQGNHAYQATTASRPTLSARYNGLLASEKFNDANWTWQASFTSEITSEVTAPDGTNTAWKVTSIAANAALSKAGATGYKNPVFTVWCKAGTWNPSILVRNATTATNLVSGALGGADTTSTYGKFSSVDLGGGWRRLRIEITSGVATTDSLIVYVGSTGAVPVGQYLYLWKTDLREAGDGVGLPEYQRVVDASTYDTAGFPLYIRFDGIDDGMQTAAIDFSAANRVFGASAIRKMADGTRGVIFELGGGYGSPGSFNQEIYWFAANVSASYSGSVGSTTTTYACTAPTSLVLSVMWDLTQPSQAVRVNGALYSTNTFNVGGGFFQNSPIYIGRRVGTSVPFNGRLYGLLIRAGAANDAQIGRVERYLNQKAKVF